MRISTSIGQNASRPRTKRDKVCAIIGLSIALFSGVNMLQQETRADAIRAQENARQMERLKAHNEMIEQVNSAQTSSHADGF